MDQTFAMATAGLTHEEVILLDRLSRDMTPEERHQFMIYYRGDRKDPQTILILTILGMISIAGIHRLVLGQILIGIVYLFTAGLCFIGTIIDIVKHKELTLEYNRKAAHTAYDRVKGDSGYVPEQLV